MVPSVRGLDSHRTTPYCTAPYCAVVVYYMHESHRTNGAPQVHIMTSKRDRHIELLVSLERYSATDNLNAESDYCRWKTCFSLISKKHRVGIVRPVRSIWSGRHSSVGCCQPATSDLSALINHLLVCMFARLPMVIPHH